ncbi:MAG: HD domain-containing protein [Anaeromusa sp.]|uniref:HD-GYP domain-containing protein n=1 Tax=Anaeromusa sp. TaxID=1872520 RepID=UPI002602573F|nr:HD domain-containing phosphohydrolase [Anaeromusa sp.]MDD3157717.1 HD domain-containing protein [Anaeromusa sp.]MEA4836076.1 HD domain-containing protein [Anaeromusa sp.]
MDSMLTLLHDPGMYPGDPETNRQTLDFFLRLIEMKNSKLYQHCYQVANYAMSIAAKLGLPREELERIRVAALLHDIGQLTVPNAVITKMPYVTPREATTYKSHCNAGSYMLENIPCFQEIIPYIRYHHERWDGKGYPKRLKGVNIPLGARILAVANHYDRFINPCTQNWVKTKSEAVQELLSLSGMAFDPEVVKAFVHALGRDAEQVATVYRRI